MTDTELLRYLKFWRRRTSEEEDKKAFQVVSDFVMEEIVKTKPQTLKELGSIRGVGPTVLSKYGEAILGMISGTEPAPAETVETVEADVTFPKKSEEDKRYSDYPLLPPAASMDPELKKYAIYSDRCFSPMMQRAFAEQRKWEAERPKTLNELLTMWWKRVAYDGYEVNHWMVDAIVEAMPKTIEELNAVNGMNHVILERYGEGILRCLREMTQLLNAQPTS